ncbi:MAG: hypothetical protein JWP75_2088, partial [Frondihabitans sp.]|nr:hypothetical protein [Frondihabitans sp.]
FGVDGRGSHEIDELFCSLVRESTGGSRDPLVVCGTFS